MSASQSARSRQRGVATTSTTIKTTSSGVYNRDFQQHLIQNAVYPHGDGRLDGTALENPENWNEVQQMLARPRPSLSPSRFNDEDYEQFVRADTGAWKEKDVSELVIPIIEGKIRNAKYRVGGISFTNLDPLTDSTLKLGNLNIYYGARPHQLSQKVRDELSKQIIPSTQTELPILPIFFLAVKGPDGSAAVAKRQACCDGALGARAIQSLLSYRQDEPVSNNASTITSVNHDGTFKMYTSHVALSPSPGARLEDHMTLVNAWCIIGNL